MFSISACIRVFAAPIAGSRRLIAVIERMSIGSRLVSMSSEGIVGSSSGEKLVVCSAVRVAAKMRRQVVLPGAMLTDMNIQSSAM